MSTYAEIARTPADRLLRLPEVEQIVGFRKTKLYRLVAEGLFPRPRHLAGCAKLSRWSLAEIEGWMAAQFRN